MKSSDTLQALTSIPGDRTWDLQTRGMLGLVAFSAVLSALTASQCHHALMLVKPGVSPLPSILFGMASGLWWGVLAAAIWWIARRFPSFLIFSAKTFLLHTILGTLLSVAHMEVIQGCVRLASLLWPRWGEAYGALDYVNLSRFGLELVVYGMLFAVSGFLHMQSHRQRESLLQMVLQQQLTQAQLHALQMQMEPHFLFNTLNAITSLVAQHKNAEAIRTLGHLDSILRTTLQRRSPEKVPFTEELQLVESYLAIQKVRFADRIEIDIQTTSEARRGLVPSFLLQPLVENAVRHGIESRKFGGRIETKAERLGDQLWMQVRDNGNGVSSPHREGHGIGLRNIKERLTFFYPNAHQFEIESPSGGGYQVTIRIPFEEAPTCN